MQYSAILLAAYLLSACQGPEGPMGPATSPKTTAEQAADTTACVVINITGETVVYQGDNPDTNTVTVYDTVAVDTGSTTTTFGNLFAFIEVGLHAGSGNSRGARSWTITNENFSEDNILGVYLERSRVSEDIVDVTGYDDVGGSNWMEFGAWGELFASSFQTAPTCEISDGKIVITDPDGLIRYGSYLGILLAG